MNIIPEAARHQYFLWLDERQLIFKVARGLIYSEGTRRQLGPGYAVHGKTGTAQTVGRASGIEAREHSWFAGHQWSFSLCGGCGTHLGWSFRPAGGAGFHGLILDRLRTEETDDVS